MKKLQKLGLAIAGVLGLGVTRSMAVAQDWSSVSTDVTAEITAVMPVALAIFGAVIAVAIGKKVFKRIAG